MVVEVGRREEFDIPAGSRAAELGDAVLAPGFVDIHVHGAAGHDVMEATAEELACVERNLAKHGTTSYFPTTVTASLDVTLRALERLADAIENHGEERDRARPIGIHLEGPFISCEKRGVHSREYIRDASVELFERFWQAGRGHIKMITVAPEIPGATALLAEATRRGVCVSIGHSNASLEETAAGVEAGARHATHTFNAMRAIEHRDPGVVGAVLTDDRVTADIIADGVHVDPAMVRLFLIAKGPERAVLITDAISATGMPDGRYTLGGMEVELEGGKCMHEGRLAGSVLTLDRAVRNVMEFAGWPLEKAVRLATLNAARVVRMDTKKGLIASGADAEFVVLSSKGEVIRTIIA